MEPAQFDAAAPRSARVADRQGAVRPGLLRRRRPDSTGCRSASSTSSPGTACSAATCSSTIRRRPQAARARSSRSSTRRASRPIPARHGTSSDVVIALNFAKKLVLIGGTSYAGEIKKSIFTRAQLPAAAAGRAADALLGQHRRRRRRRRCSSACRAPARRRCRAIPSGG